MLGGYRFRFFSAQGIFPFLLLAGFSLDRLLKKVKPTWTIGLGLGSLALFAPTLFISPTAVHWAWGDTTFRILAGQPPVHDRATAHSLFRERLMKELVELVQAHSTPEELITCNLSYIGGMLNTLTGRATTTEMLREMTEQPLSSQIERASLIVWLRDPYRPSESEMELEQLVSRYQLKPIGKTSLATVWRHPQGMGRRRVRKAVIPWWMSTGLILLAVAAVVRDLKK